MAKLNEETVKIKISELLKDTDQVAVILDTEILEQLLAVLQELVGDRRLVEVIIE